MSVESGTRIQWSQNTFFNAELIVAKWIAVDSRPVIGLG